MNTATPNRRSLRLLSLACLVPLPFCLGALLVNIELAIRFFVPSLHLLDRILPAGLYRLWAVLSADLSTVSTLIPVMILAFPLGQAIRVLRRLDSDPTFAQRLGPDPYPAHFGFFQVMLGLTGTLYGMYIGLDVSGVSELAGQGPTADTIRQSLDRLLGGTATALLSSLVGLIGAFITARPVPWLFGRVTGVKADESRQTLTATIEKLTDDLRGLSKASQVFADQLNPENARQLLDRLERQENAAHDAVSKLDAIAHQLEVISQGRTAQERQVAALEHLVAIATASRDQQAQANASLAALIQAQATLADRLSRLDTLEQAVKGLAPLLESQERHLAQLAQTGQQTHETMKRLAEGAEARQQETLSTLAGLAAAATAQREQVQRDQDALRSALAAYLNPLRHSP